MGRGSMEEREKERECERERERERETDKSSKCNIILGLNPRTNTYPFLSYF